MLFAQLLTAGDSRAVRPEAPGGRKNAEPARGIAAVLLLDVGRATPPVAAPGGREAEAGTATPAPG